MLPKVKIRPFDRGFIGVAKNTDKAPYREKARKAENRSWGKESNFITPEKREDIERCNKGIKR